MSGRLRTDRNSKPVKGTIQTNSKAMPRPSASDCIIMQKVIYKNRVFVSGVDDGVWWAVVVDVKSLYYYETQLAVNR